MKVSELLEGVDEDERKGVEFAIDFIKDRNNLDTLSNLSNDDMNCILKLYTVYEMFMVKTKDENGKVIPDYENKAKRVLEKYLALRCSVNGFRMHKLVDIFKTDVEFNQNPALKQ